MKEMNTMDFSKIRKLRFFPTRYRIRVALNSIKEKFLGLDFSMPDRMYDRKRNDGAMYVASPDPILYGLLGCVDIKKYRNFFDVGCGKGYVLWKAKKYGFEKVGGIEYDAKLYEICMRNLKRLKLQKDVTVVSGDARDYGNYGDYDVFYFFNPFKDEVMHRVIEEIIDQCRGKEIMLIYYRPRFTDAIDQCGYFTLEHELHDDLKGYDANVYHGVIPE